MAEKRGGDFGASWVASGDLSASQYRLVRSTGTNDVFLPTSGQQCVGILQNKPKNDEHAAVIGFGYTKLFLGGSLGALTEYMAGNNGAITAVVSGSWTHGFLLTAGNSGDVVEAVVGPGYLKSA